MTRFTNFGRKRKYLEAGFVTESATASNGYPVSQIEVTSRDDQDSAHPRERRGKTKKSKVDDGSEVEEELGAQSKREGTFAGGREKASMVKKYGPGGVKSVAISGYKKRTEQRRLKRVSDRQANTVCFACREKGHTAKDCPKPGRKGGDSQSGANTAVGMCYRCGSTKHTLSRCQKPEDSLNPLPFASCFVCSRKGHLASGCPENKGKGIYPNGGSCKLCGEKSHLAKDCELRRKYVSGTAATTIYGTGGGAGADEDDFHAFKRKNAEITKDEKGEDRRRRRLDVKAGFHTGTVKAFGKDQVSSSKSKKVVFF